MKRNKLILFFILSSTVIFSQINVAWLPVRPGIRYNFKIDSSAAVISDVLYVDSVSASQSIFYFNKIVKDCDTCSNSSLVNDPYDSTYILNNQPSFLKDKMEFLPGNSLYFKGPGHFILKPYSPVSSSWLFDSLNNIAATILSKTQQAVFGNTDSVCRILLSNNDTIVLSKNTGLLKFPVKTTATHYYTLAGTEGFINSGISLKRFHDFFNFSAGDILQFSFSDTDYNIFPPKFINGRERWDILSVNVYTDSVCCAIKKTYYDSLKYGGSSPAITSYSANVSLTFKDSVTHLANFNPLEEIAVTSYMIYNNGQNYIHKVHVGAGFNGRATKSFGENCPYTFLTPGYTGAAEQTAFQNVYLNRNSIIIGRELTDGLGFTSEVYNAFDRIYQRCLIGYVKGQETYGTIYSDALGISSLYADHPLHLFFDHASQQLIIEGPPQKDLEIKVFSSAGQLVALKMFTFFDSRQALSTGHWPAGIYTVTATSSRGSAVKKIAVYGD